MNPADANTVKVHGTDYYTFGRSIGVVRKGWGILYEPTLNNLYAIIKGVHPNLNFRSIRVYTGSSPDVNTTVSAGFVSRSLESTEELQFALKCHMKNPLRIVAYQDTMPTRPNSPPPPGETWLNWNDFTPRDAYEDPPTDSEEEKRMRDETGRRNMPRTDIKCEQRLTEIRARIRRLKICKNNVKAVHKAIEPGAIHSDDDPEWRVLRHLPGAVGPQGRINQRANAHQRIPNMTPAELAQMSHGSEA